MLKKYKIGETEVLINKDNITTISVGGTLDALGYARIGITINGQFLKIDTVETTLEKEKAKQIIKDAEDLVKEIIK